MLSTILTVFNIMKIGFEIIDRFRSEPGAQVKIELGTAATFRETVRQEFGESLSGKMGSDKDILRGLNIWAQALSDWQVSSTHLCPLLLRKTQTWGTEEKNLGFFPAYEDENLIENAYQEWKSWIEKGPRNNEGLLVFFLESPHRNTIDRIVSLNDRKTGWYHTPKYGCLDVHNGTFYGPPPNFLEKYMQGYGGDTFWNEIMKGLGCIVT